MEQQLFNNISVWLDDNRNSFAPPVCNKLMHGPDGQLFVMFVGGPNQRKDFHLEEGEELFYMVQGDMCLKVLAQGRFHDIVIREGEIFLLPARIPHSPQRHENTIGLVIERQRLDSEKDCVRYYVDGFTNVLYERWIQCTNLGTQIAEIIRDYLASEEHVTGKPKSTEPSSPAPFTPDSNRKLAEPFPLTAWLHREADRVNRDGKVRIFDETYQSEIFAVGGSRLAEFAVNEYADTWIWQFEGRANLEYNEGDSQDLRTEKCLLAENSSFLIRKGRSFRLVPFPETDKSSFTIVIVMDPRNKKRTEIAYGKVQQG